MSDSLFLLFEYSDGEDGPDALSCSPEKPGFALQSARNGKVLLRGRSGSFPEDRPKSLPQLPNASSLLERAGGDLSSLRSFVEEKKQESSPKELFLFINQQDNPNQQSALHTAVQSEAPENVVLLLCNGAQLEARDTHGRTPLMYASKAGSLSMVELLLEMGASAAAVDNYKMTPAHLAMQRGYGGSLVRLLVRRPEVDLDAVNCVGETVLHKAVRQGDEGTAAMLIEMGASASVRANAGLPLDVLSPNSPKTLRMRLENANPQARYKASLGDWLEESQSSESCEDNMTPRSYPPRTQPRTQPSYSIELPPSAEDIAAVRLQARQSLSPPSKELRDSVLQPVRIARGSSPLAGTPVLLGTHPEAGVLIEHSTRAPIIQVDGFYEPYFESYVHHPHRNFQCVSLSMIVSVLMKPTGRNGEHRCLVRSPHGYHETTFQVTSGRFEADILRQLSSRFPPLRLSSWKVCPASSSSLLLELEVQLAVERRVPVGFVVAHGGQTLQEAMLNEPSETMGAFAERVLGCERTTVIGFGGYAGDLPGSPCRQFYHAKWDTFEFALYVAPFLEPPEQRRFVAGTGVLLVFIDDVDDGKLSPSFLGPDNAVAIVVRPCKGGEGYQVSVYRRVGVHECNPMIPDELVVSPALLREAIWCKLANCTGAAHRYFAGERSTDVWKKAIDDVIRRSRRKVSLQRTKRSSSISDIFSRSRMKK